MATSRTLRSCLHQLAAALDMTPAALYERQRELVRAGLLTAKGKKGPGAGVELSAESLAMLLISVLVTDSLSEVAVETADMAAARAEEKKCPITGKTKFKDALAAALEDRDLSERVGFVGVTKAVLAELILHSDKGLYVGASKFNARRWDDPPRRLVSINIEGYVFSEIAEILHGEGEKDV